MEQQELSVRERMLIDDPSGMAVHDSLSWNHVPTLEAEVEILGLLSEKEQAYLGGRLLLSREKFFDAIARYIRLGMAVELGKIQHPSQTPADE